jgi:PAS domain-containing protein
VIRNNVPPLDQRRRAPSHGGDDARRTEENLRQAYDDLQKTLRERTATLEQATEVLHTEIEQRKRVEAALKHDIAERRKAQEALVESEWRFRMVIQGVTDYAIFMLDRDGYITNWNVGAQRIHQYTAGEIVGQHQRFFEEEQQRGDRAPQSRPEGKMVGAGAAATRPVLGERRSGGPRRAQPIVSWNITRDITGGGGASPSARAFASLRRWKRSVNDRQHRPTSTTCDDRQRPRSRRAAAAMPSTAGHRRDPSAANRGETTRQLAFSRRAAQSRRHRPRVEACMNAGRLPRGNAAQA